MNKYLKHLVRGFLIPFQRVEKIVIIMMMMILMMTIVTLIKNQHWNFNVGKLQATRVAIICSARVTSVVPQAHWFTWKTQ